MNHRIKRRLRVAFGWMIAACLLVSGVSLWAFDRALDATEEVHRISERLDAIQDLRVAFLQVLMPPNDALIHGDPQERRNFEVALAQLRSAEQRGLRVGPDLVAGYAEWIVVIERDARDILALKPLVGNFEGGPRMEAMGAIAEKVSAELGESAKALALQAQSARDEAARQHNIAHALVTLLGGAAIVFSILGVSVQARRLAAPLAHLMGVVREVSRGNLGARADVHTDDEIEELALAFNRMCKELQIAEEKLVQAGRLAAIGQVAVTLQHEIMNPLQCILSVTEVLALPGARPSPEELAAGMDSVKAQVLHIGALVRELTERKDPAVTEYLPGTGMISFPPRVVEHEATPSPLAPALEAEPTAPSTRPPRLGTPRPVGLDAELTERDI